MPGAEDLHQIVPLLAEPLAQELAVQLESAEPHSSFATRILYFC